MRLIILFSLLCWSGVQESTRYFVTHVRGEVILKRTGQLLKVGDALKENDKLKLLTKYSTVGAVSIHGKRFKSKNDLPKNEFHAVLNTFLFGRNAAATKSNEFPSKKQLIHFFSASKETKPKPFLILEELNYPVFAQGFEQTDEQYFVVSYEEKGGIHRYPLQHKEECLIINSNSFPLKENLKLSFAKQGTTIFLTYFKPVFPPSQLLKQELKILIEKLKATGKRNTDIYHEDLLPYLEEFYGKPEETNLQKWLEKHLQFKV